MIYVSVTERWAVHHTDDKGKSVCTRTLLIERSSKKYKLYLKGEYNVTFIF